jgi:hypothetical protein
LRARIADDVRGVRSSAEVAAKIEARKRPTDVATTKPVFLFSSRTPGVASA